MAPQVLDHRGTPVRTRDSETYSKNNRTTAKWRWLESRKWQGIQAVGNLVVTGTTVVVAFIALKQWQSTEETLRELKNQTALSAVSANAAKIAADMAVKQTILTSEAMAASAENTSAQLAAMGKQVEATDRPWLKIVGAVPSLPLRFHREGSSADTPGTDRVNAGIRLVVQNIGKAPAVDVTARIALLFPDATSGNSPHNRFGWPVNQQKAICSTTDGSEGLPFSLFPDEDSGERLYWAIDSPIPPIGYGSFYVSDGSTLSRIAPTVVGCVCYRVAGFREIHRTRFVYSLGRINESTPSHPFTLLKVGTNVEQRELVLLPHPFGGFSAD